MKRSEVIKIIENFIPDPVIITIDGHIRNWPSELVANRILNEIEKAGMLPPLGLSHNQIYPPGHKFHNPDFKGNLENEWEQE